MRRDLYLRQTDAPTSWGQELEWHVVLLLNTANAEPSLWREREVRPSGVLRAGGGPMNMSAPLEDTSPRLEPWDAATEARIRRVHGERIAEEVSAMREKFAEAEREAHERATRARADEEERERRMAALRASDAAKKARWVAMSEAERRAAFAAANACPVHEVRGTLCPGERAWDDMIQSHEDVAFLVECSDGWMIL